MFITIVDDLPPEQIAKLQALYSRSNRSVLEHLEQVRRTGSASFMERYYVGYGHKSIGDCGTTTLFFEGVSLLAAKAIQDWALYSGQETSTRYVDMTAQPIIDPIGSADSARIHQAWMRLYVTLLPQLEEGVRRRYPRRDGEDVDVYDRAVKARAFDIARSLLPAGITTQLSWHTNLRQAGDHLLGLVHHVLPEVQDIGLGARAALAERYASSRGALSLPAVSGVAPSQNAAERLDWEKKVAGLFTYQNPIYGDEDRLNPDLPEVIFWTDVQAQLYETDYLRPYQEILIGRPRGCVLPRFLTDLGQLHFDFPLDFGSFRDIQRHRDGVCRMPLLTLDLGFEPWYLEQFELCLTSEQNAELLQRLGELHAAIERLDCSPAIRQYYIPLGYRVPTSLSYALPAAVYVLELRTSKTVHGSLRRKMLRAAEAFSSKYPWVTLHIDRDPDDWDIRRGTQTILEKPLV